MSNDFDFDAVERIIGYHFRNRTLLKTAFTHSSYAHERAMESYEKLEFLGDSVLGLVVAEHLLTNCGEHKEGVLTTKKADIVKKQPLTETVERLGLFDYMIVDEERREELDKQGSKVKSDLFESVVGAIYLDGGHSAAKEFIFRTHGDVIARCCKSGRVKDDKTRLQECVQDKKKRLRLAEYFDMSLDAIRFDANDNGEGEFCGRAIVYGTVLGEGRGKTKKEAEQLAAAAALVKMKDMHVI